MYITLIFIKGLHDKLFDIFKKKSENSENVYKTNIIMKHYEIFHCFDVFMVHKTKENYYIVEYIKVY